MAPSSRVALLDAVRASIREDGLEHLTLRAVARRAGLSHAAPGKLFGDRRGLLTAFATAGYAKFADRLHAALDAATDGPDALRATGRAYVAFAVEEPEAFDLMFRLEHLHRRDPAFVRESTRAFGALRAALDRCVAEGGFDGVEPPTVLVGAWSLVHGLATLYADGRLAGRVPANPTDLARAITDLFVAGLPTRPSGGDPGL
jgi:AcrR family transcriptional regulator